MAETALYQEVRKMEGMHGYVKIVARELSERRIEYTIFESATSRYHKILSIPPMMTPRSFVDDLENGLRVNPEEFLGKHY